MTAILLPLTSLPGLDPRGLEGDGMAPGNRLIEGLINGRNEKPPRDRVWFEGHDGPALDAGRVTVSLADPATRDAVARWLAERVGLEVGATAPGWLRIGGTGRWMLDGVAGDYRYAGPDPSDDDLCVPSLASIDLADPQADWLALAAVARHVGGGE